MINIKNAQTLAAVHTHTGISSEWKNVSKVLEKTLKYIFIWDSS